jgi:hypothetical protein
MFIMNFFSLCIIGQSLVWSAAGRRGDGGVSAHGVQRLLFPAFVLCGGRQADCKLPVCLPTVPGLMRRACAVVV